MTAPAFYRGSGLLFQSDIALTEYTSVPAGNPDAVIETGERAARAAAAAEPQTWEYDGFQASSLGPVIVVPDVAAYLVTGGNRIDVSPVEGSDPGMVRLYLIGSAIGMLFHQRGQVILHGAAVVQPSGITLFTGPSGAGKSTLAAHLAGRGHAVLGDDTLPLDWEGGNAPKAWPGARVFKLCQDAADRLETTGQTRIAQSYEKIFVDNPCPVPEMPVPLAEIVLLERTEATPELTRMDGLEAVAMIARNTYRPEYLRLIGTEGRHFEQIAALSTHVRTYRLARPWDATRLDETLDLLSAHWGEQ